MSIYTPPLFNNSVQSDGISPLFIEDIIKNTEGRYKLKNIRRLNSALSGLGRYKKIENKALLIWKGVNNHKPFDSLNEIASLEISDAFLKMNRFRLMIDEPYKVSSDLYCFALDVWRGLDIKMVSKFAKIEKVVEGDLDVWGFCKEYEEFCGCVKDYFEKGMFSFEKEGNGLG